MLSLKKENMDKMAISELKRYRLRMQIMSLLYKKTMQSASALSKKTHVSLPTVRSILDDLMIENIVRESGTGDSIGGRKPTIYSLSEDAYYILAVELGHYKAKAVLYNSLNKEVGQIFEFKTNIDDPQLEERIEEALLKLLAESQLSKEKITAIGVSMPGLIDSEKGMNQTIKDQQARNIRERLTRYFNIRTYIENDARMQALGEFVFGKAKNTSNTAVLNWNWGLGLGIILNGEIYRGSNGCAGELSHIRVIENGALCECGKRGCLQTIASAQSLLDLAREEVSKGTVSRLTSTFAQNPQDMLPIDIVNSAKKGDELSISLLGKISTKLAWGLSILIQLYNPELIVLNGPLTKANQYILIPIRQALNQYCLENISEKVRIEISEMGESSGLNGVAVMVFQKIFRDKSADV